MKSCSLLALSFFLCFLSRESQASPCCARSPAVPMLVVGDNKFQMSGGTIIGKVVAETNDEGAAYFGSPQNSETNTSYRLDMSGLLTDRVQAGMSLVYTRHSVARNQLEELGNGFGDTRINVGYEFLPVWKYSEWKPQGFLFSTITIPTGRPIYESNSGTAADVLGDGFFTWSLGSFFVKRWTSWDAFAMLEVHYSLNRWFEYEGEQIQVKPGFGGGLGFGIGVSPWEGPFRIGVRVQPRLDQARVIPSINSLVGKTSYIAVCDTGLDLGYALSGTDTLMASYTDQTLLGHAVNSALNRVFAVNFQHRWLR